MNSVSAMCRFLEIPRSSYYYTAVASIFEAQLETAVKKVFLENKARFGTRKIKQMLATQGICLSRRRIRRMMKRLNLVCIYQKATVKPYSKGQIEAPVPNRLNESLTSVSY